MKREKEKEKAKWTGKLPLILYTDIHKIFLDYYGPQRVTKPKKPRTYVCTHITSKRIQKVWSGFEFDTKPDQPGLSRSIRLEVVMEQS